MPLNVSDLESVQQDYLDALADDALNPSADYSLDGQTVSRTAWRDSLWKKIEDIQKLLQFAQPFELRGTTN